ncbi:MAG TPA: hypothetical protein ENH09_04050 [Bacteroidetes bacterium]|nr:hypothetical protein [Bacteroidota bacterium]
MKRFQQHPVFFLTQLLLFGMLINGIPTPSFAQTFEGYWEQAGQVSSRLPVMGKTVEKQDHRIFITKDKIKTIDLTNGRTNIFRYDRKMIYRLNPGNKTYADISFSQFESLMKRNWSRMDRMNKRLTKKLKHLKPKQRRRMIQLLGGDPARNSRRYSKITMRWPPGLKTILGYKCRHLQLLVNNKPFLDAYWTKAIQLPGRMLDIFNQFGYFPYKIPDHILKLRGFPLQITLNILYGAAKIAYQTNVTKIVRTPVSDKEFQIPRDYRRINWTYMKLF